MNEKQRKEFEIENAILEIVDAAEDMPRTDVQGAAQALAMKLTNEIWEASA